jgi:hypothetical protein
MIPIDELISISQARSSLALGWFERLGRWVVDEPDPRRQRWFATACHRLGWHAELWIDRRPAVPHDAIHSRPEATPVDPDGDRCAALAAHLHAERDALTGLADRIDPDLDPATLRVIRLVDADLVDLLDHRP